MLVIWLDFFLRVFSENFSFVKIKELFIVKQEKECAIEELIKAQDTISRLRLEKCTKSIDLYDPNTPEILHRKLSNENFEKLLVLLKFNF